MTPVGATEEMMSGNYLKSVGSKKVEMALDCFLSAHKNQGNNAFKSCKRLG
jgi:hypothetical protein